MSYFRVETVGDDLPYYAWADNGNHAIRKVEMVSGPLPPQRVKATAVVSDDIPPWADVIEEPILEREARLDGVEE